MAISPWKPKKTESKLSFKRAFIWIVLSTILISGTTALLTLYYFHVKEIQLHDDRYNITMIDQVGKEKGRLSTSYLAEVLDLASNTKTNLIGYKTDHAREKLLSSPVINSAKVRKVKPRTLAVEYSLRMPLFRVVDFENAAIDKEGVVIPLKPFYEDESLPELYLGNLGDNIQWGTKVLSDRVSRAFEILVIAQKIGIPVKRIDVSKMEAPSFGERQVVLVCNEGGDSEDWMLRLRATKLSTQLEQLANLRKHMLDHDASLEGTIIDLRAPDLAFMQKL